MRPARGRTGGRSEAEEEAQRPCGPDKAGRDNGRRPRRGALERGRAAPTASVSSAGPPQLEASSAGRGPRRSPVAHGGKRPPEGLMTVVGVRDRRSGGGPCRATVRRRSARPVGRGRRARRPLPLGAEGRLPELAEGPAGASMTGAAVAPGPEVVSAAARRAGARRLGQRAAGGPVYGDGGWGMLVARCLVVGTSSG